MLRLSVLASLLLAAACTQAYSDGRAARPQSAPMVVAGGAPAPAAASPFGVEIVGEDGRALATYEQAGRYYVLGAAGSRYLIHVTNPTDRRVEAVVSVDGLDVIDGEPGDLAKRGYVVPPHGDLSIEGFRTSTSDVATFRFSSVAASYAGRKGIARNVGVIAVALFDEQAPQQIIVQPPPPPYDPTWDESSIKGYGGEARKDAEAPAAGDDYVGVGGGGYAPRGAGRSEKASGGLRAPVPTDTTTADRGEADAPAPRRRCCDEDKQRGGLGTEYGERRYSAASWTEFVRASDTPTAVAELRYNDAAGLAALGIQCAPPVTDAAEVTKRETADPFPGDPSFSRPPAGIR